VRSHGFTLIELLVATAVLALVGTIGYRGLDSIIEAEARLQAESRRWSEVALLFSQLSEDLTLAVGRTTRDAADRTAPALLVSGTAVTALGGAQLALTRLGIGEGSAAQSAPRRVGYRLQDGALQYLIWPDLDVAPGTQPAAYELLAGVAELQWQALDADGRWTADWPAQRPAVSLPRAVSVRLVLAGGAEITRIVPLR
jgi:general secretion pathway protein J